MVAIPWRRESHIGQVFGIGVTIGVVVGFVVGSAIALRLGDETIEAMQELISRWSGRDDRVNFELLLQ